MRRSDHGLSSPRPAHWSDRALCKQLIANGDAQPDDWYPPGKGASHLDRRAARRLCNGCEVWRECLDYAVRNGEPDGVWGGFTPQERRRMAKAVA